MMIKTTPPRFGQKGFTLIEIVMVLVLLGILAAVAVPKYFDLQEEAEERAMAAIAAEFQARVNGVFAREILAGKSCGDAWDIAREEPWYMLLESNGKFMIDSGANNNTGKEIQQITISLSSGKPGEYKTPKTFDIQMPRCENYNK